MPHCNVVTAAVDISDRGSVERLFSDLRAGDAPGVPDVLVNNAGACVSIRPIVDSDPEQWWNDAVCSSWSIRLEHSLGQPHFLDGG